MLIQFNMPRIMKIIAATGKEVADRFNYNIAPNVHELSYDYLSDTLRRTYVGSTPSFEEKDLVDKLSRIALGGALGEMGLVLAYTGTHGKPAFDVLLAKLLGEELGYYDYIDELYATYHTLRIPKKHWHTNSSFEGINTVEN